MLHHVLFTYIMEAVDITEERTTFTAKYEVVLTVKEIGKRDMTAGVPVIWHITVGLMECVPTQTLTAGPRKKLTKRTPYGATICQGANETAPNRFGRYLQVTLI